LIKTLDRIATGGLKPDLTILLDIPAREGLERGKSRSRAKDRMEREKISFHDSVRSGYLEIARNEPGRIKVIRSSRVIKETSGKVIAIVNDFLGGKSR
jgi:dTMP kinase